jgi:hypothetical protein
MLNCGGCGLTNRPYDTNCSHCDAPLQDVDIAAARRRDWDALTPKLREEMERNFDRMRQGTVEYVEWLNRHRIVHAVLGAMLVNMSMNGSTFFQAPWTIPVDLALGAGAGLLLNRWHGGVWHGAGVFFGAGVISMVLKLPILGRESMAGAWLLTCFALFFLAIMGYLLGLKLDFEHADRTVTR